MKKLFIVVFVVVLGLNIWACTNDEPNGNSNLGEEIEEVPEVVFTGEVNVFNISEDKYLRGSGREGDLSELGNDEYYSFCMKVQYNGTGVYKWDSAYVTVDGGEPWYWQAGEIQATGSTLFHIAYVNMEKCMTEGTHTVVWYFDGQEVYRTNFMITKDMVWEFVFSIPSTGEIAAYQKTSNKRSPYLYGWFTIPNETKYTEYMVDFKADHLPRGTYCCLGNWKMDYSSLENKYQSVSTEYDGVHAYAGFQNIDTGDMVSIMSFWDVYCTDASGNVTTIRAKRVYPETTKYTESFGGEGTGAHCSVSYPWEAEHWYRMHLKCVTSQETGNTVVQQWVCDLETGEYTLLCAYDTGVTNSSFQGSTAIFLENYLTNLAGEVRSMEVCNAKYLNAATNMWQTITEVYLGSNGGYPTYEGSYNFGVSGNKIWMITSGIGGDWYNNGKGKQAGYYTLGQN